MANDSTGARIDAHMIGKQHTGYQKIRRVHEEFTKKMTRLRERREMNNPTAAKEAAAAKEKTQVHGSGGLTYRCMIEWKEEMGLVIRFNF